MVFKDYLCVGLLASTISKIAVISTERKESRHAAYHMARLAVESSIVANELSITKVVAFVVSLLSTRCYFNYFRFDSDELDALLNYLQ